MDLQLSGKTALVLGSSRGIGFATAKMLAAEGCAVVLNGRSAAALREATAKILADHPQADISSVVCNLASEDDVLKLSGQLQDGALRCDILVNNTGGPAVRPLRATSAQIWQAAANSMLFPVIELSRAAVEPMAARGWGRVITIVSSGVQQPLAELGISNTLRSGIVAWSKTLANELAASGITANCVIPGRIDTERLREVDTLRAEKQGLTLAQLQQRSRASIPIGRYGEPDEMARAICFLAAAGSGYITGTTLRVDGGLINAL